MSHHGDHRIGTKDGRKGRRSGAGTSAEGRSRRSARHGGRGSVAHVNSFSSYRFHAEK